jgi:glutathione S-transferase
MALALSGLKVELREVVLRDKPPEMLEISPKGTVPVLFLPGGRVLEESLDVMHWALGQNDPENWLAHVDADLIAANDGPFKQALDRYKYPHRYDLPHGLAHRDEALKHLELLDGGMAGAPFLRGDQRGFADIALFPFVRQFAGADQIWFDAQPLPALQSWLSRMVESELFALTMQRYPQWKACDAPTQFP